MNQSIDRYLSLIAERPDLIRPVASYPVVTDRDTLIEFARKTGLEVGVVCDNGVYWKVLADVIRGRNDTLYRYMRVVPTQKNGGSVVIPVWYSAEGEPRFGLLCEDRHPIRQEKNITFPRGHLSPGISDEANAVKELCEEMGVDPADIAEIRYLGISHPDSGLTGSSVHFYEISLSGCKCPTGNIGHEGIRSVQWVSEDTLREMFSDGRITCGFAYTAYLKHLLPKD